MSTTFFAILFAHLSNEKGWGSIVEVERILWSVVARSHLLRPPHHITGQGRKQRGVDGSQCCIRGERGLAHITGLRVGVELLDERRDTGMSEGGGGTMGSKPNHSHLSASLLVINPIGKGNEACNIRLIALERKGAETVHLDGAAGDCSPSRLHDAES